MIITSVGRINFSFDGIYFDGICICSRTGYIFFFLNVLFVCFIIYQHHLLDLDLGESSFSFSEYLRKLDQYSISTEAVAYLLSILFLKNQKQQVDQRRQS
jgi:hypothetical protein